MTDFNILNKVLKDAWIPRIKSGNVASWKIIPNEREIRKTTTLDNCNYDINTGRKFTPFLC